MTNREIVRDLLEKAGPTGVTTGELLAAGAGSRYGARIKELREQGLEIESELERPGSWRYRLVGADVGGGRPVGPEVAPARASCSETAAEVNPEPEPMCWFGDFTPEGYDPERPFRLIPMSEIPGVRRRQPVAAPAAERRAHAA